MFFNPSEQAQSYKISKQHVYLHRMLASILCKFGEFFLEARCKDAGQHLVGLMALGCWTASGAKNMLLYIFDRPLLFARISGRYVLVSLTFKGCV